MKMTETKTILLSMIREMLEYKNSKPKMATANFDAENEDYGENMIELYEDSLIASGLTRQYIQIGIKQLEDEKIIKLKQIFYAPERTVSNYDPEYKTRYKVPADDMYKMPVYVLHIDATKLRYPNPSEPLKFDENKSAIFFKGRVCDIPDKSLEHYVLRTLLSRLPFGTKVSETDISDSIDPMKDAGSSVRDATRRINKKAKEDLGIEKLIRYKRANYWLEL